MMAKITLTFEDIGQKNGLSGVRISCSHGPDEIDALIGEVGTPPSAAATWAAYVMKLVDENAARLMAQETMGAGMQTRRKQ